MRVEMSAKEFAEYTDYLKRKPKRSKEWIELQKRINDYCRDHRTMRRSFATQQNFIYGAIKFVTGINQIDRLKGKQVLLASNLFNELTSLRDLYSKE